MAHTAQFHPCADTHLYALARCEILVAVQARNQGPEPGNCLPQKFSKAL